MAKTLSHMLPLGTKAPPFCLRDTIDGTIKNLTDAPAKAYLVMFICNHCPYVKFLLSHLVKTCKTWQEQGVAIYAINSNDITHYPEDAPENMQALAKEQGFNFPYLFDEDQSIARAYNAACTPDFFLFDSAYKLVYRGQFDDARPSNNLAITGESLHLAIQATLQGQLPSPIQKPSMGCNIKFCTS